MNPRPLGEREQNLLRLYIYCQLRMTLQRFYSKWGVSQEQIASICDRDPDGIGGRGQPLWRFVPGAKAIRVSRFR